MIKRFVETLVGFGKVHVFSDNGDGNRKFRVFESIHHCLPVFKPGRPCPYFKQVDDFIVDVNAYTQQAQQAQQSQAQLRQKQEQVLDLQMQLEQMKVQIQQMEAKTKQQKVMFDYETDKLGIDQDMQEALVEVDQKDKDSKRKHKVDLLRHILDRGKKA